MSDGNTSPSPSPLLSDGVFWSGIAVIVIAAFKFSVQYCHRSKCENFSLFWGAFTIQRNVQAEIDIARIEAAAAAAAGDGNGATEENVTVV